ncbi:LOW QUALITY PROTEIN: hypothetical protein HID58_083565 [Brassica napus]|uniref:Thionin-like protein 2 n=1 Tax=Brassica napus TaxID=3708 RepID=A0ABQ7YF66_BRANA|nr:LOW QUALITY PROTEIN: hypothetical protein HID58_083565 [Brassica napus]
MIKLKRKLILLEAVSRVVFCAIEKKFPTGLMCPFTCFMTCLPPPTSNTPSPTSQMILANEIDHTDYFCKLGCASHRCLALSSLQNPNVDKVVDCVDSCSNSTGETIIMLITIMIVMAMGNFVAQTQAQDTLSFRNCYPDVDKVGDCVDSCSNKCSNKN